MVVIEAQNLWKRYGDKDEPVLRGINLSVQAGEFLAIAGSSGSGKSTLLSILGCLDFPSQGEVWLDGIATSELSDRVATELRAHRVGFIFQRFNLIQTLRAVENVEYPLLMLGVGARDRRQRSLEALDSVGLLEFARRFPAELSGGQQQRVAIARAVVKNPSIILADEPTASLDSVSALRILELMKTLNAKHQTTFVFSSHDRVVLQFAARTLWLTAGQFEARETLHVA